MVDEDVQYSYEYWDCACGNKALRGDITICPNCGRPRDAAIQFYRKDAGEVISGDAEIDKYDAGPDWVCSFCKELNPAVETKCRGCGHERFASDTDYFQNQEKKQQLLNSKKTTARRPPERFPVTLAVIALALIGGFAFWANRCHSVEYEVTKVHWNRSIPLERYKFFEAEDWRNQVHGDDVAQISTHKEIRSYERRLVGTHIEHYTDTEQYQSGTRDETSTSYESLGNGAGRTVTHHQTVPVYSTRTVHKTRTVDDYRDFPIYDTKVKYRAKSFAPRRTVTASGDNNTPEWPTYKEEFGVDKKPDREGTRVESFSVTLTKATKKDKGPDTMVVKPDYADFRQKFVVGRHVIYKVNNLGSVVGEYNETKQ